MQWKHESTKNYDMMKMAWEHVENFTIENKQSEEVILPIRSEENEDFFILYDCHGDETQYGCLQKDILIKAKELESHIQSNE